MKFDFNKFKIELCEEFREVLEKSEIEELLNLEEEYNKDNPLSTGKKLRIDRVSFLGKKENLENQDYTDQEIDFTLPFESGVNILIADNFKGKSSLFKIIKFALTGKNTLKNNIKKWISHYFVNFSINEKKYTVYLDTSKRSIYACLVFGFFNKQKEIEENSSKLIFESKSETEFKESINKFFFDQFTYYSLKWTQKSSSKKSDDLLEVGATWGTYFKSILLESKDSNTFYGDQNKKVFQMLLGMELTYPINRLTVKRDMLIYEMAKRKSHLSQQKDNADKNLSELQLRLKKIDNEIKENEKESLNEINIANYYKEYNNIIELINSTNIKINEIKKQLEAKNIKLDSIRTKKNNNDEEISRLNRELEKAIKQKNDLTEYIEIGILFSNLDFKKCPSCNTNISEHRKKNKLSANKCSICNEDIKNENSEHNRDSFLEKIKNLDISIKNLKKDLNRISSFNEELSNSYKKNYAELLSIEQEKDKIEDLKELTKKAQDLENIINKEKRNLGSSIDSKREKLISEKAIIKFQIKQLSSTKKMNDESNHQTKIDFLDGVINKLSKERYNLGLNVIRRLQDLMLDEIQTFGLNSITEVEINDNFEIYYKQDNDYVKFDNIAEGEQLRVKIAFYLSLILLDIEFNFSKHTRLLIIDSPGKEEADSKYLNGLATILESIESRYKDKLQILVGTSQRNLSGVIKNEIILPVGEYVF